LVLKAEINPLIFKALKALPEKVIASVTGLSLFSLPVRVYPRGGNLLRLLGASLTLPFLSPQALFLAEP
jgi:hypothetical protein